MNGKVPSECYRFQVLELKHFGALASWSGWRGHTSQRSNDVDSQEWGRWSEQGADIMTLCSEGDHVVQLQGLVLFPPVLLGSN